MRVLHVLGELREPNGVRHADAGTHTVHGTRNGFQSVQAVMVGATSSRSLATGMASQISDSTLWGAHRARAVEFAKARFSAESVAAEYARLLKGLANACSARIG